MVRGGLIFVAGFALTSCASLLSVEDVQYGDADAGDAGAGVIADGGAEGTIAAADTGMSDAACAPSDRAGFLYAIGGELATQVSTDTVFVAPISCDGSLGDWAPTTKLLSPNIYVAGAAFGRTLVISGGEEDTGMTGATYQATIGVDGLLGQWAPVVKGNGLWRRGSAGTGDRLYLVGGVTDPNKPPVSEVDYVELEGGIATLRSTTPLPVANTQSAVLISGSYVISIGGGSGDGGAKDVWIGKRDGNGDALTWASGPTLPADLFLATAVSSGTSIFVLGGVDYSPSNNIFSTELSADGTLTPWTADAKGLGGAPRVAQASAVFGGRVYMAGGATATGIVGDVQIGTPKNGRIEWVHAAHDLPLGRQLFSLVAVPAS